MNKMILSAAIFAGSAMLLPSASATTYGPCDYILKQNCGGSAAQSCATRSSNYSACLKRNRPKDPRYGQQKTDRKAVNNSGRSSGKATPE
jgi:hypothetical protein